MNFSDIPSLSSTELAYKLTSPAFEQGGRLPEEFTIEGGGKSPPLAWDNAPSETRSFVIEMVDTAVPFFKGGFTHWMVYNLSPTLGGLEAGISQDGIRKMGGAVARNGAGRREYYPPCPVKGAHPYGFRILALDLPTLSVKDDRFQTIRSMFIGNVLAQAELVGYYQCRHLSDWQAWLKNMQLMTGFLR